LKAVTSLARFDDRVIWDCMLICPKTPSVTVRPGVTVTVVMRPTVADTKVPDRPLICRVSAFTRDTAQSTLAPFWVSSIDTRTRTPSMANAMNPVSYSSVSPSVSIPRRASPPPVP